MWMLDYLEKGVRDMKTRLDEFDNGTSKALCIRVCNLEKELGLDQGRGGLAISERISIIENSFSTRIGKLEDMVYKKGHSNTSEYPSIDRLAKLETELGVDQKGGSMFSRISALKNSIERMHMHFSEFEGKAFQEAHANEAREALYDRLVSLGEDLGTEPSGSTLISKVLSLNQGLSLTNKGEHEKNKVSFPIISIEMLKLEEDIKKLRLRVDEMQGEACCENETEMAMLTLPKKLSILERELGLMQNGMPLLSRISGTEENIIMRIIKLEDQTFAQGHVDKSKDSFIDRLCDLEKALGVKKTSSVVFQRIKSIEIYIVEAKSRITKIEKRIYGADNTR
eukprot:235786-Ditylum_brightwellii.AAC.1